MAESFKFDSSNPADFEKSLARLSTGALEEASRILQKVLADRAEQAAKYSASRVSPPPRTGSITQLNAEIMRQFREPPQAVPEAEIPGAA